MLSLTVAATRVLDFEVEHYSMAREMAGPGESFQSDAFTVGGYDWAVRLAPAPGVSLKLALLSEMQAGERVGVKFGFMLLDKSGEASAAARREKFSKFFFEGQEEGFDGFMCEKDLVKYVHGDCFVVRCTVSVLRRPKRH
ncbi:hypothetical protein VPH35_125109 [Triticum aestivum]